MIQVEKLQQHFIDAASKMSDLPVYNRKLQVATSGFRPYLNGELGVLVTPWCMNLILLQDCTAQRALKAIAVGDKEIIALPSGRYEFLWGEIDEVGGFLSCSLFSPMFEFETQELAIATADEVMTAIFEADNYAPTDRQISLKIERGKDASDIATEQNNQTEKLSRRGFLTGRVNRRISENAANESL